MRGTVRKMEKAEYVKTLFKEFGNKLEFFEVPDITKVRSTLGFSTAKISIGRELFETGDGRKAMRFWTEQNGAGKRWGVDITIWLTFVR